MIDEGDLFDGLAARIILNIREMKYAAIYDRASTRAQQDNNARRGNALSGLKFANHFGLEVIKSGDARTDGISFLDVISGIFTYRPSLDMILNNQEVDTIIVAIGYDRLARGEEASNILIERIRNHNKNLIVLQFDSVYNAVRDFSKRVIMMVDFIDD